MIAASGPLGNGKSCSAWAGEHRKHPVDSAEALKRAALAVSRRTSPVVVRAPRPHEARSCRGRRCPQSGDQRQDFGEHLPRYGDLGHLEGDIAAMADDLRTDLDQLLLQARQRPIFDRLGRRQRAQEVAEIVSERVKLKSNGVGGK